MTVDTDDEEPYKPTIDEEVEAQAIVSHWIASGIVQESMYENRYVDDDEVHEPPLHADDEPHDDGGDSEGGDGEGNSDSDRSGSSASDPWQARRARATNQVVHFETTAAPPAPPSPPPPASAPMTGRVPAPSPRGHVAQIENFHTSESDGQIHMSGG